MIDSKELRCAFIASPPLCRAASLSSPVGSEAAPGRRTHHGGMSRRRPPQRLHQARGGVLDALLEGAGELVQSVANEVVPGVVGALDIDEVVQRLDIQAILDRVDMEAILAKVDINE